MDAIYVQVNPALIPSKGQAGFGADYHYRDEYLLNGITYYYLLEDVDFYGRRSQSGPVSATPYDLQLIWPEDGELVAVNSCLFSWYSSSLSSFKVDISFSESFSDSKTVSFPGDGWTQNQYFYFTVEALERLALRAEVDGSPLYWRVRALGANGEVVSSATRRILLAAGKVQRVEERQELRKTLKKRMIRKKF